MNSATKKQGIGLIMFVVLLSAGVFWLVMPQLTLAQKPQPRKLFPISKKGKCGFIDVTGKIRIAPVFDNVENFSEGLAAAEVNRKWGYIDEAGKWVIKPKFDMALQFSEGLAQVRIGGRWSAEPVYLTGGQAAYIDRSGKIVFTLAQAPLGTTYNEYPFSEGRLPFEHGPKYGYLDQTGRTVIAPTFAYAGDFSEGLAGIVLNEKFGFIDKNGKVVIALNYLPNHWGNPEGFSEGLVSVRMENGKLGYLDKTGAVAIAPQFYWAESFSEGLAVIQFTQDGKCGYIDKSGKLVISPEFELAESFSEGLAAVRIDCNLWGYINRTGKLVIEPQFRSVKRFSGGLAEITIGERWGYINQSGKVVWMSGPPTSQPKP